MDKQLLKALDNLSDSLEQIAAALESKKEGTSATGAALKGGDFGKQLEAINTGVKSIKVDTQAILKNQETILALSKKKESEKVKGAEVDKKKEGDIKKGVATILLIAVAVLAIGLAFKIVGKVDFLSVIGLALAITIVSVAFEKIAKLKISIKEAAVASLTMVMMAAAITISSWILSIVKPVSISKMFTSILIGAGFALLGKSIAHLVRSFDGISIGTLVKTVIFLPLILPAIALGIAGASYAFGLVKPVSLSQWISSILIAGIFTVVAFGIRNMLNAFKGLSIGELIKASIFLPIILPAIALGIAGASYVLGLVKPVSFSQWITSILIGALFVVLSFGIRNILQAFKGLDKAQMLMASLMIPVLLPAMAAAIWGASFFLGKVNFITFNQFLTALGISILFVVLSFGIRMIADSIGKMKWSDVPKIPVFFTLISIAIMVSSHILNEAVAIDFTKLLKIGLLGGILALITIAMVIPIKAISKIGMKELLIGSLAIIILAGVIMVTSHILALGNYDVYPGLDWIIGVGLSLLTFGVAAFALGWLVFGPQALIFLAGLVAVLAVAGTIVAASHILAAGKYDNKGMLEWAKATALLYLTFTPIIMALGMMGIAGAIIQFFGGDDPFEVAKGMMVQIAETIVLVSKTLSKGNYKDGPTEDWAKGISLALGAFMPVYKMLVMNSILSIFGGGGVGPDDFSKAIITVSTGIITAAELFSSTSVAFKNPPPVAWAKGVGMAIGAFAPVFKVLSEEKGWFVDGPSVQDMKRAILTISEGIVTAAYFFANNKSPFKEGNYPTKKWGEGVGAALGAFAPVFEMLSGKSWFSSSDEVIMSMTKGILVISKAIMASGFLFSKGNPDWWKPGNAPSKKWGEGVGAAIGAFSDVFTMMSEGSGWFTDGEDVIDDMSNAVIKITRAIAHSAKIIFINRKYFDADINPNFVKNLSKNVVEYTKLAQYLAESEAESTSFFGGSSLGFSQDPILGVAKGMFVLANAYDKLSASFDKFGNALEKINMDKLREVKALQTEQLANDLNQIKSEPEDKGIWSSIKSGFGFGDRPTVGDRKSTAPKKDLTDKSKFGKDGKTVPQQLDILIDLLTSIDSSTNTIDEYIASIDGSIVNTPPKL